MLVESNSSAKAILELISVVNISSLVMGTGQTPFTRYISTIFVHYIYHLDFASQSQLNLCNVCSSRLSRKGLGKGQYVKKHAPDFCEVILVYDGRKMKDDQHQVQQKTLEMVPSKPNGVPETGQRPQVSRNSERNFFECACFSGKSTL